VAVAAAEVAEQAGELVGVVVAKRPLARGRGGGPPDDAVVGQFVVQDQVFGPEQVGEQRGVGAVAAGEDGGPLGAEERGQLPVELVEEGRVAPHHPAG